MRDRRNNPPQKNGCVGGGISSVPHLAATLRRSAPRRPMVAKSLRCSPSVSETETPAPSRRTTSESKKKISHYCQIGISPIGIADLKSMMRCEPRVLKNIYLAASTLTFALSLCGCVFVGGYRSGSGVFVWPGSLAVAVIVLLLVFVFRRR
jgi:hypothetical protein